jgi:hypothetical protein
MDQREAFTRALKEYPSKPAAQDALIARIVDEARLTPRTAVSLMSSADADLALNAELFLRSINELAIQPLLEAPTPDDPAAASARIHMMVEPELELRKQILLKLDALLEDRRPIPPRPVFGPTPEERPKPRRVCDDAYVAMRSLIYVGEELLDQFSERDAFLSQSDADRDAAIRRARQSARWRRALDRDDVPPPNEPDSGRDSADRRREE